MCDAAYSGDIHQQKLTDQKLKTLTLLFVLFLGLSASMVHAQQWEQLPLYGGHLFQLRPSTFDRSVILGFQQNGELYYSSDAGKTWKSIYDTDQKYWSRLYDVEVLQNGQILAVTITGLWTTADLGKSWRILSENFNKRISLFADLNTCTDGSIFVSFSDGISRLNLKSVDNCQTWDTLSTEFGGWGLFVEKQNSDLIMKVQVSSVLRSLDGGKSWEEYALPDHPRTNISASSTKNRLTLSIFLEDFENPYGDYYYYEI